MAEIEYWLGQKSEIESIVEYWLGQNSEIESIVEYWLGQGLTVEGVRNRYIRILTGIEGLVQAWLGQGFEVEARLYRYIRTSYNVEEAYILALWSGLNTNIEVDFNWWLGQRVNIEEYSERYFSHSAVIQNYADYYLMGLVDVESFTNLWNKFVAIIEVWKEKHVKQSVNVEWYFSRWAKSDYSVEAFSQKYIGCKAFIKPSVYVRPDFGTYNGSIEVEIEAELLPLALMYGFGRNMGEYKGKFKIFRDRKLYVEADYDVYKVKKEGEYKIRKLEGKKVYSDLRDAVWISEELLWKEY